MTRTILSSALLALAASAALAVGSTGRLDDLSTAAGDARSALADAVSKEDLRTRKSLDRLLAALDRIPGDAGLASELKGASKAAGLVEGRLAAVEGLAGPLAAAAEGYGEDVLALRGIVEDVLGGGSLEGKALAAAEKRLVLVDRFLAKAAASATRRRELAALAAAARHAAAVPDDGSGGDLSASWVLSALSLAPAGTGHDFDGNGTPNNALGSMLALLGSFGLGDAGASVDAALAAALADGSLLLAVEMWDVRSFSGDPSVTAGFEAVSDTDGDPSDNFSGGETFAPVLPPAPDGRPLLRTTGPLAPGGDYHFTLDLAELPLGLGTLDLAGPVHLEGTASPTANAGIVAFSFPPEVAIQLAILLFPEDADQINGMATLLGLLADVDTDGDGTKDALSGAMVFDAVPCTVAVPAE